MKTPNTIGIPPTVNIAGFRSYLVLLHAMFLSLYVSHLRVPETGILGGMIIMLAALTIMLFIVPRPQLYASWFLSLLILGNGGILFGSMPHTPGTEAGMIGALILLLAMASYISSIPHFVLVSGLLVSGYGWSLHQADLLHTATVLLLPAFLCVTLVFLSKMGIFQAEIERLTDNKSRQPSTKDPLTGLANRAYFLEQLGRVIQYRYVNRNFHFAVLFIDLDGFKPVNDTLGHKAGDAVLRQTAKLLQGSVRKGDLVGRYGGDEFTVLLNSVKSPADATRVAEAILAKVRTPIDVGEAVVVGASIGIAMSTNLHEGPEDLIRDADGAMYRAKAQGKNCYIVSDESEISKAELKERWKRVAHMNWSLRDQRQS
jgi:diguanylate cyclase (GGDEF)-like protein